MVAPRKKTVVITVDDKARKLNEVADDCKAAGLDLLHSLEFLGQITGEIDPTDENVLRRVPGVLSVEESIGYQLPPPDSDVQ